MGLIFSFCGSQKAFLREIDFTKKLFKGRFWWHSRILRMLTTKIICILWIKDFRGHTTLFFWRILLYYNSACCWMTSAEAVGEKKKKSIWVQYSIRISRKFLLKLHKHYSNSPKAASNLDQNVHMFLRHTFEMTEN